MALDVETWLKDIGIKPNYAQKYANQLQQEGIDEQADMLYIETMNTFDTLMNKLSGIRFLDRLKIEKGWKALLPQGSHMITASLDNYVQNVEQLKHVLNERCDALINDLRREFKQNKNEFEHDDINRIAPKCDETSTKPDFNFNFGPPQPKCDITRLQKQYGDAIRLDSVIAFYQSFMWNHVCYKIGDFIEILTTEGTASVAKIINIYLDQDDDKAEQCVVEWFWKSNEHRVLSDAFPNDEECLIFSERAWWYLDCIAIPTIAGKASIHTSKKACLAKRKKIQKDRNQLKQLTFDNKCIERDYFVSAYCLSLNTFNSVQETIECDGGRDPKQINNDHDSMSEDEDESSESEGSYDDSFPSDYSSLSMISCDHCDAWSASSEDGYAAIPQQIELKPIHVKQRKPIIGNAVFETHKSREEDEDHCMYNTIICGEISTNDEDVKKVLKYMNDYWRVKRVGHIKMGALCTALNEQVFENGLCIKRLVGIIEYLFTKNRVFYVQNEGNLDDSEVHQL
eukprot:63573_1